MDAQQIVENAGYLREIRSFFDSRGYHEVLTNHRVPAGAFEASIDCLPCGTHELHTSPEFEMKRLLATTQLSLYQICRCFRDDPATEVHAKEFTMLEYYRVGASVDDILQETGALVERLAKQKCRVVTMQELVQQVTGLDIFALSDALMFRAKLRGLGMLVNDADSWSDLFFKLLVERVEPAISPAIPTFVTEYPAALCALGKLSADGRTVRRFELYWKGMEICNGCEELGDAGEVRQRYQVESQDRRRLGKSPHPEPARLFEAFDRGLPHCSGVAIGLERLFACLSGRSFRSYQM